jgi:sporulation protein YlmC with PRC-barrel domain
VAEKQNKSDKQITSERSIMKKSRKFNSILAAAALCAVSAGSTVAVAQEISTDPPPTQQRSDTTTPPSQPQQPTDLTPAPSQPLVASKCSQLIGTSVINQQGQKLGKITDVVVTFDNERVSYCVMSVKHGIFSKTRFVAVPLAAFQPSDNGSCLILNSDKASLDKAKGFARNEWPSAINPAWGAEPAPAEELPPVTVFAPPAAPVPPSEYPSVTDPAMGPAPARPQSATAVMDALRFELTFGYVTSGH